jgi:hypothetical protein
MGKLLYKPFGALTGVLGGLLAGALFKQAWKLIGEEKMTHPLQPLMLVEAGA